MKITNNHFYNLLHYIVIFEFNEIKCDQEHYNESYVEISFDTDVLITKINNNDFLKSYEEISKENLLDYLSKFNYRKHGVESYNYGYCDNDYIQITFNFDKMVSHVLENNQLDQKDINLFNNRMFLILNESIKNRK